MSITITDKYGRTIDFHMDDSTLTILSSHNTVRISRDDARELRRFLEALG